MNLASPYILPAYPSTVNLYLDMPICNQKSKIAGGELNLI